MAARRTLGVTGDAGCGKSTVLSWLAARGAATLDTDRVVHGLLETDSELVALVVERFGPRVLATDGTIDRRALAAVVFADREALRDLEALVHPRVQRVVSAWLIAVPDGTPVAAVEAVKLIESGMHEALDEVWLVVCDRSERQRRLLRRGWSKQETQRRLAASPPLPPRLRLAAQVIDNSGSESDTRAQLEQAWRHLVGCRSEEGHRVGVDRAAP